MSEDGERELIELVAREQRGFRTILFTGLATLMLVMIMSAGMGYYYYDLSQKLASSARALQQEAFDTRIKLDQQNNRVSAQERRIRRVHEEIRALGGRTTATAGDAAALTQALKAAGDYLLEGRLSFADERLIETQADATQTPEHALLRGVLALTIWERNGDPIPADAVELPELLLRAQEDFALAAQSPPLAPIAQVGQAWVRFLDASSPRSSYSQQACAAVLETLASSAQGAQPLYWKAQCERKSGRPQEAARDYAQALEQASAGSGARDEAARTLLMNAYHGLGTTLIASADAPDSEPQLAQALGIAAARCPMGEAAPPGRMQLAAACLRQAMMLRRSLRQTQNEVSGSAENLSFAHLREGDFASALKNAQAVKETGLFAWNELVRAVAAANLPPSNENRRVLQEARRHISFFRVEQFNFCELQVLMNPDLYREALEIVAAEHAQQSVTCDAQAAG